MSLSQKITNSVDQISYRVLQVVIKQPELNHLFLFWETHDHWQEVKHGGQCFQEIRLVVKHSLQNIKKKTIRWTVPDPFSKHSQNVILEM